MMLENGGKTHWKRNKAAVVETIIFIHQTYEKEDARPGQVISKLNRLKRTLQT